MTKQEQLQELQHTYASVSKLKKSNIKEVYDKQLLPIAQSCCDNGFVLKVENGWFNEDNVDLTFDVKDNWGFEFHIRLDSRKMIEISHGLMSGLRAEQRPFIIQRDKIIGRLWDKETELLGVFEAVKQEQAKTDDLLYDIQRKIWRLEDEIKQEETDRALKELVAGSKWYYAWDKEDKRPLTIIKITKKLVFLDSPFSYGEQRIKIEDIVGWFNRGEILKVEGDK